VRCAPTARRSDAMPSLLGGAPLPRLPPAARGMTGRLGFVQLRNGLPLQPRVPPRAPRFLDRCLRRGIPPLQRLTRATLTGNIAPKADLPAAGCRLAGPGPGRRPNAGACRIAAARSRRDGCPESYAEITRSPGPAFCPNQLLHRAHHQPERLKMSCGHSRQFPSQSMPTALPGARR
jgi:hypothetical protein